MIFFTPCVTGFIDDLFNDSFRDTLVWNAVINFHCLFQDLRHRHFHDLFCCVSSTSVSSHFIHFFVRELLNELSDRMDNSLRLVFLVTRLFDSSLYVIALSTPLSFNFARWFTVADNSMFTFVSVFSRVLSCALGCSCVQLLDRCAQIRHLFSRSRHWKSLSSSRCPCSFCTCGTSTVFCSSWLVGLSLGESFNILSCAAWSGLDRFLVVARRTCCWWPPRCSPTMLDGRPLVCGLHVVRSGHPRPSPSGTSVPWVSLPGPTGVQSHPSDVTTKRQPLCGGLRVLGQVVLCRCGELVCGHRWITLLSWTPLRLVRYACSARGTFLRASASANAPLRVQVLPS